MKIGWFVLFCFSFRCCGLVVGGAAGVVGDGVVSASDSDSGSVDGAVNCSDTCSDASA